MADNNSVSSSTSLIDSLNSGLATQTASKTKGKGTSGIGKDEFLTMLVTQLKNQDPLDPMKNEDFAVNLAQFSSLEQLIGINDKVGKTSGSGTDGLSSYASFLGREVSVKSDEVNVNDNDGGSVNFDLPAGVKAAKVEVLNIDGSVAHSIDAGALAAGRHRIDLKDLDLEDGAYKVKVTTESYTGKSENPATEIGGIVTGLVPGENPVLLLGAREVKVSDVSLVQVAAEKKAATAAQTQAAA